MADTLKTRVARVMAGGVHALIDRLENKAPDAMMEQALRELDGVVDELRHELGLVTANRHLAQQRHAELNQQHEALREQLALALSQRRDDLARAGVGRQLDIEAQLPLLETSLADLARQESEHRTAVDALLAKRREMEGALSQFRQSRVAAGVAANGAKPAGPSVEARVATATEAFDRLYERQTGLSGVARGVSLQQAGQLRSLEELVRDSQIEARLAQLKQSAP